MRPSISTASTTGFALRVNSSLRNESVYGRLTSHFSVHFGAWQDTSHAYLEKLPIFANWSSRGTATLANFLACERADIERMQGRDLGKPGSQIALSLRFCESCMREGYHPVLFQHLALFRCDRHGELLRERCPHCLHSITPTVSNIRRFPWMCDSCEAPLSSLRTQRRKQDDFELLDAAWNPVRKQLCTVSRGCTLRGGDMKLLGKHFSSPALSRTVQRASLACAPLQMQGWRFKSLRMQVDDAVSHQLGYGVGRDHLMALTDVLKWLSRHCSGADEACELIQRLGKAPQGLRLNRDVAALPALLCKTLYCYGLTEDFFNIHFRKHTQLTARTLSSHPIRYSRPIVVSKRVDARLVQLEILGLLAFLIATTRRNMPLAELSWHDLPLPAHYVPSWHAWEEKGGKVTIEMRARANETNLVRLFLRSKNWRFKVV